MKLFFPRLLGFFYQKQGKIPFSPKNLTNHYKNEILDLYMDEIYIVTEYKNIENLLVRFKYQSQREIGGQFIPLFEQLLTQKFPKDSLGEIFLVPIPMHWTRYFSRGFDHTLWLSKKISQKSSFPFISLLSCSFFSRAFRQSHLSREKRLANKRNHFRIKSHQKIPEKVFLIDDVISTGSTANECARLLKDAGVQKVIGIFLASNLP
ncbi:ComF family protein [Candidatus Gracilibacteria bacterium]|nr:ComF family protein [Candidatus Gracilibacteria bacterium]